MTSTNALKKNTFKHFHIDVLCTEKVLKENDKNAATILAKESQLSKQKVKNLMQHGAVWLSRGKQQKRIRKANISLQKGDTLKLYYNEHLLTQKPESATLLEDFKDYSLWYKPPGLLSQGTQWGDSHSLLRQAELDLKPQRAVFLVHRLDREACGLMLIAHSKAAAAKLSEMFAQRHVEKDYLAIVSGKPTQNTFTVEDDIEGKQAISHFKLLHYNKENNASLIKASIETGRKHQIRIHLKKMNLPILGDSLYGQKNSGIKTMKLCAISLSFLCPITSKQQDLHLPEQYLLEYH